MKEELVIFETAKLAKEKGFEPLPTQSILQKWLREEHNLEVNAYGVRYTGDISVTYYTYSVNGVTQLRAYKCDTYENALEAGLLEALKSIKD